MMKKSPTRTCIACGTSADKRQLIRFVRDQHMHVSCDASGKAAGRGAYICANADCFATARTKRLLDARLRVKVSNGDYDRLEAEFCEVCDQSGQRLRECE